MSFKKSKEDLIYDLIFNHKEEYIIDISNYMDDIYNHEEFIDDIKKILKQSKVTILKSSINIDSRTVIWELKVSK